MADLSRYCDLGTVLIAVWALGAVRVVKYHSYASLCNTSLATLVDEILLILCAHL